MTTKDSTGKVETVETYTMADSATMMQNWMAYATPGEPHKMLAKSNGTWTGDMTMWMAPGAPPQKMTGTATYKMILDGRYQQGTHSGNMGGMPFEGISTTTYDNFKKLMVSSWIDNMGTGIMMMEGPWDAATKTATLKGKAYDPSAGKEIWMRQTWTPVDDNTEVMEMYKTGPDGKEFKCMEIKATRK